MLSDLLQQPPCRQSSSGRPWKNERSHRNPRDYPIPIMSTGPLAAHRDKAGHPFRAHPHAASTRHCRPPRLSSSGPSLSATALGTLNRLGNIGKSSSPPLADMEGPCQGVVSGMKGWGRRCDPLGNLLHRGGAGAVGPPRTSNRDGCRGHPEPASPPAAPALPAWQRRRRRSRPRLGD